MKQLLEELFARYYKDVYSYLYSLSHDASLSEDLASEVFLEVVKSIALFRGDADIKTWLYSIARHRWYHHLRKKQMQAKTELLAEFMPPAERPPEDVCYDQQVLERIYEILDKEPERVRSIVLMRLEGFSFYEIAAKHGISESSARVIDFRAKTKIRQILKKEGFTHE
ncbi:MAG: RNA polymerase sigma factor [Oscillibacter sp.]|nr:RNA polymerase sigma factor [Oscillibacter sp.]